MVTIVFFIYSTMWGNTRLGQQIQNSLQEKSQRVSLRWYNIMLKNENCTPYNGSCYFNFRFLPIPMGMVIVLFVRDKYQTNSVFAAVPSIFDPKSKSVQISRTTYAQWWLCSCTQFLIEVDMERKRGSVIVQSDEIKKIFQYSVRCW